MKKLIIIALFAMAAFFPILFIALIPLLGIYLIFETIDETIPGHHGEERHPAI